MFRILAAAAEGAADANARVDLESLDAVRVDQLHGHGTLPVAAFTPGVDVDAFGRVEQVGQVCHQRDGRDGQQGVVRQVPVRGAVHYVGVHPVVEYLSVHRAGGPGGRGRHAAGGLLDDIGEEDVRLCFDGRRFPAIAYRDRSQARGPADLHGTAIHRRGWVHATRADRVRLASVQRVTDRDAGCVAGDRHTDGAVVETVARADLRLLHESFLTADVPGPGRGRGHEDPGVGPVGEPAVGDVCPLLVEADAVDDRSAVGAEKRKLLAPGIQREGRVQARGGGVFVGPDDQESMRRNRRLSGSSFGNLPFRRGRCIVRQVHAPDINRSIPRIVQLDPVVVLALRVSGGLGVRCKQFVDYDRGIAARALGLCKLGVRKSQRGRKQQSLPEYSHFTFSVTRESHRRRIVLTSPSVKAPGSPPHSILPKMARRVNISRACLAPEVHDRIVAEQA